MGWMGPFEVTVAMSFRPDLYILRRVLPVYTDLGPDRRRSG